MLSKGIRNGRRGLLYKMDIYNPTSSDIVMQMFNTYNGQSQTSNFYEFSTVYTANYISGDAFRITYADTTYVDVNITSTTAREDVLPLLNALGIGTWTLDETETSLNIFRLSPSFGVTLSSFSVKIFSTVLSDNFSTPADWTLNGMTVFNNTLAMILNDFYKTGQTENIGGANTYPFNSAYSALTNKVFVTTQGGFWIYDITTDTGTLVRAGSFCLDVCVDDANGVVYYTLNSGGFVKRIISSGVETVYNSSYVPANGQKMVSNHTSGIVFNENTSDLFVGTFDSLSNPALWIWNIATDTGTLITNSTVINGDLFPISAYPYGYMGIDKSNNTIYFPLQDVGIFTYNKTNNTGKLFNNASGVGSGSQVPNTGGYYPHMAYYDSASSFLYAVGLQTGIWEYDTNADSARIITTATSVNGSALPLNDFNYGRSVVRINNLLYAGTCQSVGSGGQGVWIYDYDSNTGSVINTSTAVDSGTQLPSNNIASITVDTANDRALISVSEATNQFYILATSSEYTTGDASRTDLTFTAGEDYRIQFDIDVANSDTFNVTVGGDVIDLTSEPTGTFYQQLTITTGGALLKFDAANDNAIISALTVQARAFTAYTSPVYQNGYRGQGLIVQGYVDLNALVNAGNSENFIIKSFYIFSTDENQVLQPFDVNWYDVNGIGHSKKVIPIKDSYQTNNAMADIVIEDFMKNIDNTPYFKVNGSNFINWNIQSGARIIMICHLESNSHTTDLFRRIAGLMDEREMVQKYFGADLVDGKGVYTIKDERIYIEEIRRIVNEISEPEEKLTPENILILRRDAQNRYFNFIKIAKGVLLKIMAGKRISYFESQWLYGIYTVYGAKKEPFSQAYVSVIAVKDSNGSLIVNNLNKQHSAMIIQFLNAMIKFWESKIRDAETIQNKKQFNAIVKPTTQVSSIISETGNVDTDVLKKPTSGKPISYSNIEQNYVNTAIVSNLKSSGIPIKSQYVKKQVEEYEPEEMRSVAIPIDIIKANPKKELPKLIEMLLLSNKRPSDVFNEINEVMSGYIETSLLQSMIDSCYRSLVDSGRLRETGGGKSIGSEKYKASVVSGGVEPSKTKPKAVISKGKKSDKKPEIQMFGLNGFVISLITVGFLGLIKYQQKE